MKLKILVVQPSVKAGETDKNIDNVKNLLDETNILSSDLIVLPELWTTGWDCPNFNKYSEPLEVSKTYKFLKEISLKYNTNVIGGSSILRKPSQKDRNTCIILNRKGEILDKFHLFSLRGEAEGSFLEEGKSPLIVKTDIGNIGISICYDLRFPEMFRTYAFNEADIIVNMAAWPKAYIDEYITLAKARAIENQIYFICASLTGKINEMYSFGGNSMVIDFHGKIVAGLNEEETVLQAEIDTDIMKAYRQQMPILGDTKKDYQTLEIK